MPEQSPQSQFPDAPRLPDNGAQVVPPGTDYEPEPKRPKGGRPKSGADAALPWALGAMIVLILAASGGLVTAWIVASTHQVPGPIGAVATATPNPTSSSGPTEPGATPTDQPRHTPGPSDLPTPQPSPFSYTVQAGDSVTLIAANFQVTWQDIAALNNLKAPKYRIFIGEQLLIPGYGIQPTPKPGH